MFLASLLRLHHGGCSSCTLGFSSYQAHSTVLIQHCCGIYRIQSNLKPTAHSSVAESEVAAQLDTQVTPPGSKASDFQAGSTASGGNQQQVITEVSLQSACVTALCRSRRLLCGQSPSMWLMSGCCASISQNHIDHAQ
jgi:hypothetical protein